MAYKIVFTGGGTAGHVTKNVAIIRELKKQRPDVEIEYLGSGSNYETEPLKKLGIKYHKISTGKLRRYLSFTNALDFFRFFRGIEQSRKLLKKIKPTVIFSSGGYVALPVCVAANLRKIPIISHESDSIPGLANKLIAKVADKICTTFETTSKHLPQEKIIRTGNPIRKEILEGDKDNGYDQVDFTSTKKTILIIGGSQGAKKINDLFAEIFPELTKQNQVVHLTGKDKETEFSHQNYKQFTFLESDQLANMYAIADLIVSRAGTNAITEIIALKKPNILIPLSTAAANHQYHNAEEMEKKGCSILLNETKLSPPELLKSIQNLLDDKNQQTEMIKCMSTSNPLESTRKIVEILQEYLKS